MAAPIASGLAMLLLAAAAAGQLALGAAVFLVQMLLTVGSVRYARVPAPLSAAAVACGAGAAATLVVFTVRDRDTAASLAGVLGMTLLAGTVAQLLRGDRSRLTESLAWSMMLAVLSVLLVAWVTLRGAHHGGVSTGLALTGVAVATLGESRRRGSATVRTLTVIVAGILGAGLSLLPMIGDAAPPLSAMAMSAFAAVMAVAGAAIVERFESGEDAAESELVRPAGGRRARHAGSSSRGDSTERASSSGRSTAPRRRSTQAHSTRTGAQDMSAAQAADDAKAGVAIASHREAQQGDGYPVDEHSNRRRPAGRRSSGRPPTGGQSTGGQSTAGQSTGGPPSAGRRTSGGRRRKKKRRLLGRPAEDHATLRWVMPLVSAAPVSYILGRMLIG